MLSIAPRRIAGLLLAAAGLTLMPTAPAAAQGDLLVAPTRLVLDGRGGGEIILSNIGSEEATYRITVGLRRMTPDGELDPVDETAANVTEKAALDMVRYAPRRVLLPPGQPQAIRISAHPGPELPDGEYRVHLTFSAVPKVAPVVPAAATPAAAAPTANPGGFSINLIPVYGITMPIIVRKGQLAVTAGLSNPKVVRSAGGATFEVDITRSGKASLYGDVLVRRRGDKDPAFVVHGIGVYPEIDHRHGAFPLSAEQVTLLHGPVTVEFRDPAEKGGALIASVDTAL